MSKSTEKRLLFSVTIKDCDVQTFCTGGNGGQHRNAKQNGVRVIHRASGARGEHRDGRDQDKNKREAFVKMVGTLEFRKWHKAMVAKLTGQEAIAWEMVEQSMVGTNIKVEVKDQNGRWIEDKLPGDNTLERPKGAQDTTPPASRP